MNDCTVRIEEIIYNFGVAAFMRKWQKDLADTQDPDGAIKDVAPRAFGADKADPLSSIFLFVPWYNRLFYADDRIIPEQYDHLCACRLTLPRAAISGSCSITITATGRPRGWRRGRQRGQQRAFRNHAGRV